MGVVKVANNYNDLVKVHQQVRNCRIARATLNHRILASTGANYFREEVCRYKFEEN